jgi:hypothetical protein
VAVVRKLTIPTERPPLVEVSTNLIENVTWLAQQIPTAVNLGFLEPEPLLLLNYTHKAEWTPFQSHYFSENLVVPGIEPGTFGFLARNYEH